MTETLTEPVAEAAAEAVDDLVIELPTAIPNDVLPGTTLRGLPLLDLVIHHIELSPQLWNQEEWHCETGMCVAGWTATLAGGAWTEVDSVYLKYDGEVDGDDYDEGDRVHVSARATRLLGLTNGQADYLFRPGNKLDTIKSIRDELAAGTLKTCPCCP